MKNMMFGITVRVLRLDLELGPDHAEGGGAAEWTLGQAILHILSQPEHVRQFYKIESQYGGIDHLAAQRLAESSLFERWQAA